MFGTNTIGSTLSLGKVLNGISRTLSIANQVIPLYQQVKPMIGSARKVMSVLKDLNKPSTSTTTTTINSRTTNNKEQIINTSKKKNSNNAISSQPVFFQ